MDVFNFPNTQNNNSIFYANGGTVAWQTWTKPRNCKFISILAISGGGGGGSGRFSAAIINAAGGGGGGASGTALGIFPANSLPDTLYIQVGIGGVGGTAGGNGTAGSISYVSVQPNTTSINVIIAGTGNSGGFGGTGGNAGGVAGIAPSAFIKTSTGLLSANGVVTSTAGWVGATGGQSLSGSSIQVSGITTGGAGGGGNTAASVNNAGGNITGIGIVPTITGGVTGVTTSAPGTDGYNSLLPFISSSVSVPMFFTGGAGGSSKHNGTAGDGGKGGFGSGGGGGGSGNPSGAGGRGGDGLVIITCF